MHGERGAQAEETERFVAALKGVTELPVDTFDERFTTRLAARRRRAEPEEAAEDAVAAAYLLTGYLTWTTGRR